MENNIDKLFKSKLRNDRVPYDPAAWGRMAALIDEDKDLNGDKSTSQDNRWKIYLSLALLLLLSLIGLWQLNVEDDSQQSTKVSTSNDKESWASINSANKELDLNSYESPIGKKMESNKLNFETNPLASNIDSEKNSLAEGNLSIASRKDTRIANDEIENNLYSNGSLSEKIIIKSTNVSLWKKY